MTFPELLANLVARGVSDIHMHVGLPLMARLHGKLSPITQSPLTPQYTAALVDMMCNERQKAIFAERNQVDLAYAVPGVARFRVNLFRQRGSVSCVMRVVNSDESKLKIVSLPQETINYFRDKEKGLVLVTGPTGSGKSTTLARILDEINQHHSKMIVTLEDPIEYLHKGKNSIVVQREIGQDAPSFKDGLVAAMRQDPDVIMIGEIRDHATAAAAWKPPRPATWSSPPYTPSIPCVPSIACSTSSPRTSGRWPASSLPSRWWALSPSACCPASKGGGCVPWKSSRATCVSAT